MSSGKRSRVGRNVVKPMVLAIALALPAAASYGESMTDVVRTRSDQNVYQQYGRDSVYAFSNDAKPYKPEQTASHSAGFIGNAFDKTKDFFAGAWDKTTGLFKHDESSSTHVARAQYEPQAYGRAGGYTGTDRVEVVSEPPRGYAANSDIVKSGQDVNGAAAGDEPLSSRANSTVDTRDMAGNRDTMTGSARNTSRNDSAPSAAAPNDNPPSAAAPSDNASSAVAPNDSAPRALPPSDNSSSADWQSAPNPGTPQTQNESTVITAPATEERTVIEERPITPNPQDSSASGNAPMDQDRSSAATDMRDQGTMPPSAQDQSSGTSDDVVRSGMPAASSNTGTGSSGQSGNESGTR